MLWEGRYLVKSKMSTRINLAQTEFPENLKDLIEQINFYRISLFQILVEKHGAINGFRGVLTDT